MAELTASLPPMEAPLGFRMEKMGNKALTPVQTLLVGAGRRMQAANPDITAMEVILGKVRLVATTTEPVVEVATLAVAGRMQLQVVEVLTLPLMDTKVRVLPSQQATGVPL